MTGRFQQVPLAPLSASELAERARAQGSPLIDDGRAIFVWLGSDPAPSIEGDWNDWDPGRGVTLERVGHGVRATRLAVPMDAYLEYQLQHRDARRPDPLNRHPFDNGIGGTNSCFWMPDAPRDRLARRIRGVQRGSVTRHRLPTEGLAVGAQRTVLHYRPATAVAPATGVEELGKLGYTVKRSGG